MRLCSPWIRSGILLPGLLAVAALPGMSAMPDEGQDALWLSGYARSLAGETIGYHSSHPEARTALLVRAMDSQKYIEWETEPVPVAAKPQYVTFAWLAGLATGKGGHAFDLFVDGRKRFTFTTGRDASEKEFEVRGEDGSSLAFRTALVDQFQELFGVMTLTLPAAGGRPGQPLVLRIVGESAGSRDWVMTFTHALNNRTSVEPEQALIRTNGGLRQLVRVDIEHLGSPERISLSAAGIPKMQATLEPGYNSYHLALEPASAGRAVDILVETESGPAATLRTALRPVENRELWLLPHSHNDIGYSDLQVKVERDQWRYLEEAIELARKTAEYPAEARFKWNVEILWPLETYLTQASKEKQQQVIEAVRNGWLGFEAFLAGVTTGLCNPEELFHLTEFSRKLWQLYGIPISTAMVSDIPGSIWSVVPALALSGVRYLSSGPNYMPFLPDGGDRIGWTARSWGDKPFYWVSASGQQKILFWMAGRGYSWFHGLNQGALGTTSEKPIFDYARELADKGYPYDMVQVRYTIGGDNGPPDPNLPGFVRAWNEKYESPRLVIATSRQLFEEFERRHGSRLPAFAGDMTPYWEDGALSTARETAQTRNAVQRLLQAETLWAMLDPKSWPAEEFYGAWRSALLFHEHTWGAHNSVSEPDHPDVVAQWEYKKAFALEADRSSRDLLDRALGSAGGGSMGPAVEVINTHSWPVTDLVLIPASLSAAGDRIEDESRNPVPSQRLSTGELAILAADVPGFGARRYLIKKGSPVSQGSAEAAENRLSNAGLSLTIDKASGAISSLIWKERGLELVDTKDGMGLNDYFYVQGRDPGKRQRAANPAIRVKELGPLVVSLLIESEAPGCRRLTREVRLIQGLDRIDIMDVLDKEKVREKESVHVAFPLSVPQGKLRVDVGWGVVEAEAGQLAGACKDFLSVQNWADVSNQDFGVTWVTLDSPLTEPGAMTDERLNTAGTRNWRREIAGERTLFSYLMNNYWHTNYKADQQGPVAFRYALWPHGMFDAAEARRFGTEQAQPLLVRPSGPTGEIPKPFMTIEPPSVVVTSLRPSQDGRAFLARLYNASAKPEKASLKFAGPQPARVFRSSPFEETGEHIGGWLELPAYGIVTLRIER